MKNTGNIRMISKGKHCFLLLIFLHAVVDIIWNSHNGTSFLIQVSHSVQCPHIVLWLFQWPSMCIMKYNSKLNMETCKGFQVRNVFLHPTEVKYYYTIMSYMWPTVALHTIYLQF